MLTGKTLLPEHLTDPLTHAWREGRMLSAGSWPHEAPSPDFAYAVQDELARRLGWQAQGQPQFWKSGGASRLTPLSQAPLAPQGVRPAPASFSDLRWPLSAVEAEIALRLAQDVSPAQAAALGREEAADLVDGMAVSCELVSSRWAEGQEAPAWLRQADCLSHGALALGEWQPLRGLDWSQQRCMLQINEAAPMQARGTHTLGSPLWGLLDFLRHATRLGHSLPAGSVVTTGAWLMCSELSAGDTVHIAFEGLGELRLSL